MLTRLGLLLLCAADVALAPKDMCTLSDLVGRPRLVGGSQTHSESRQSAPRDLLGVGAAVLVGGAMAFAGSAAARALESRRSAPGTTSGSSCGAAPSPHRLGVRVASRWSDSEGLSDSEDEDAWSECGENSGRSDGSEEEEEKREKKPKTAAPKLWTKEQFPEGVVGPANYDMLNLIRAQEWQCPCGDRRNCIGADRLQLTELYEFRKNFQTHCGTLGKRDTARAAMAHHYSSGNGTFSRSFVVGSLNDCCAASAGLACGLSIATWERARADLKKNAPRREDRRRASVEKESAERRHLEAYIRELRSTMEGSKGKQAAHFFTGKRPVKQRWEDYVIGRNNAQLPVIGSLPLFKKLWAAHNEIIQTKASGHDICDTCGALQVRRDALEGRTDAVADAERKALDRDAAIHDREHRGERDYGDDIWRQGEDHPARVTALNMDAPTQQAFDVPVQPRRIRDSVKRLEGQQKWSSKITGVMAAGYGTLAYVTRSGLGSGPNLSLTLMYLTLAKVAAERGLGARFNLLADGTAADNKNNEMIIFLCWLVLLDKFEHASMFVMMKGHTYTVLDQSFNTLISSLMNNMIYTVSALLSFIYRFLSPYNCKQVVELDCLWDWKRFFEPHTHRLAGFCTSQFGSGMHEFYARKDAQGVVRVWFRQSSQASSWLPEGPGYAVFESQPVGRPNLAAAKPDAEWGRLAVESTVRKWYTHMSTDSAAQAQSIRKEWEERFAGLPAGGDTNLLPNARKLTWIDLPRRAVAMPAGAGAGTSGDTNLGVTGMLENPPVNPITGPGRTTADVQQDTERYRNSVRADAPAECPAVFQADYVFVQLSGRPLALHRVVHGLLIVDATDPNLTFTSAEYVHTPQAGVDGFWGTFEKKANPQYDAKDPRKGPMFVRHRDVSRDAIQLYAVETFERRERHPDGNETSRLRVTAESLRRLSAARPDVCPMPQALPATHTGGGEGGGSDRHGERGGRGGGRGGERAGKGGGGKGGETGSRSKDRPRGAGRGGAGRGGAADGSSDEELEPPLPDGYDFARWEQGQPVLEFLIWCGFPDAPRVAWHRMRVSKALEGPRDDSFTHDASIIGDSAPHGVRGVQLDSAGCAAGLWMPIAKRQGGGSGISEGDSSSAAASDAGRGGTARKRPMREAQSKLGPGRYVE